jgi:lipopolysaccharide/colanic/teichoic acid biosynthesis glycosyltransferase
MLRKNNQINRSGEDAYKDDSVENEINWIAKYDPEKRFLSKEGYLLFKRALDLFVVLITTPITLPLFLLIMLLLVHDSPESKIIYKQLRTGQAGVRFWMYKFRTMVPKADELKPQLMHLNILEWPDFKIPDDPRVTKLGRILRKTSLDELPQLFNVIKGEMSLVGPRPTSFSASTYKLWQTERLDVPPGLTGLWQISSRGETEFKKRLMLDIAYIQHRCLPLDIEILIRTIWAVFEGKGTT